MKGYIVFLNSLGDLEIRKLWLTSEANAMFTDLVLLLTVCLMMSLFIFSGIWARNKVKGGMK